MADVATGLAAIVSGNVLSGLWKKVVQEVKMIISLPRAVTDMDAKVQRLKNLIDDINEDLVRKESTAFKVVQDWLDKASRAIEKSESISRKNETYQQHKNCLGCCPDCLSRYRISKSIRDWKEEIRELYSQKVSDFPPNGEYGVPTTSIQVPFPIPEFVGNGIKDAQLKIERLLTEDNDIRRIGVYGMGGVGKTSLLKTINNSDKVKKSFELIIWLTVSKFDIFNLQTDIASTLKLTLPNGSKMDERNSTKLYTYLKDKKFLLILDDMWSSLELESLGVPESRGVPLHGTKHKIVLSTRNREVCQRMNADDIIQVNSLSSEEGWQLFRNGAFRNGNVPQEIEGVAREIAGKCRGLPLAINVVAAAMRIYTVRYQWEGALEQMQTIKAFSEVENEIEKQLFQRLRWSYDVLEYKLKICFVYFAAYPEDQKIRCNEVTEILIAEGLVTANEKIYSRDSALMLIDSLTDRCLIEVVKRDAGGRIKRVKMHDMLRELAICIAEEEHMCYFKPTQGVRDFPEEEIDGKGYKRMSLIGNNLHSLPTSFASSSLSVLLLRETGIKEVPEGFLNELSSLKVLDLSENVCLTSLPACIGNLKQLVSLQLNNTAIHELPETIGDLKELQFLRLDWCHRLHCLPERISELERLRILNIMGWNSNWHGINFHLPRGISKLVSLEILTMGNRIELDFEDANEERRYATLKDLQCLSRLRVFQGRMSSTVNEGVMGNWSKMRSLDVALNNGGFLPQDMQVMKDLESFDLLGYSVERLPSWFSGFQKLAKLRLVECQQLKELHAELRELQCLKVLKIIDCDELEELELGMGFAKLEQLVLMWLTSLKCIRAGNGGLGEGSTPLPMLKSLRVSHCKKLKTLAGRWDKLKCLQEIRGKRKWWNAIQWEDPNMRTSLESKHGES